MGYEYVLASLPDLKLNSPAPITTEKLQELLDETMLPKDKPLLAVLQMKNDNPIVLSTLEQYRDDALSAPAWWEEAEKVLSEEDIRTAILYEYGIKSKKDFVRSWFQFNEDINNVLVATICRKHNFDVRKLIIGTNEVAEILRKNISQKDFGLGGVMSNLNEVMQIVELDNLMEREKHLDALRFAWLEEQTRFIHFSVENVLAYYLQCEMLNRWDKLTVEEGEQIFRELVSDMKKGISL